MNKVNNYDIQDKAVSKNKLDQPLQDELNNKLDKTGGRISGNLDVTGRIQFPGITNEGTAGAAYTDWAAIYCEHEQGVETTKLVLEIADNPEDGIVLRKNQHGNNKETKDVVTIINDQMDVVANTNITGNLKLNGVNIGTTIGSATLNTSDKTLKGAINEVKSTADSGLSKANTNASSISGINSTIGSAALNTSNTTLKGAINEVKTTADSGLSKANNNANNISSINSTIGSATLNTSNKTLKGAINEVKSTADSGLSKANTNASSISTINGNISTINSNISGINSAIGSATLSTSDKTLKGAINEVKTKADSNASSISGINNTLGSTNLNTSDKSVKGAINEVKSTADSALSKASVNTSSISTINNTIGTATLSTSNKTLKGAINEVFQSGVDAKNKVVNAINNNGGDATTSMTWDQIGTAVSEISNKIDQKLISAYSMTTFRLFLYWKDTNSFYYLDTNNKVYLFNVKTKSNTDMNKTMIITNVGSFSTDENNYFYSYPRVYDNNFNLVLTVKSGVIPTSYRSIIMKKINGTIYVAGSFNGTETNSKGNTVAFGKTAIYSIDSSGNPSVYYSSSNNYSDYYERDIILDFYVFKDMSRITLFRTVYDTTNTTNYASLFNAPIGGSNIDGNTIKVFSGTECEWVYHSGLGNICGFQSAKNNYGYNTTITYYDLSTPITSSTSSSNYDPSIIGYSLDYNSNVMTRNIRYNSQYAIDVKLHMVVDLKNKRMTMLKDGIYTNVNTTNSFCNNKYIVVYTGSSLRTYQY